MATALCVDVGKLGALRVARPPVASLVSTMKRQASASTPVPPGQSQHRADPPSQIRSRGDGGSSTVDVQPRVPTRVPAKVVLATDTLIEFLDRADAPFSDPRLLGGLVRLREYLNKLPMPAAAVAVAGE